MDSTGHAWLWRGWNRITPTILKASGYSQPSAAADLLQHAPVIVTPSLAVHALPLGGSNAYLLETAKGVTLIDAGLPLSEETILARLTQIGRTDLRLIFITHAHVDHYGSAAALRRTTGAAIAVHHADAADLAAGRSRLGMIRGRSWTQNAMPMLERLIRVEPTEADLLLEEGRLPAAFGLDACIVHTPGHTAGSCTLLVEGGYAFVGDLISTQRKPHVQAAYAQDWSQIRAGVEKVRRLRPLRLFPGHGLSSISQEMLAALKIDGPAAQAHPTGPKGR